MLVHQEHELRNVDRNKTSHAPWHGPLRPYVINIILPELWCKMNIVALSLIEAV